MIEYTSGNILHSDAEVLVNTVNCVGVMGRGIALQFKNAFPDNFKAYVDPSTLYCEFSHQASLAR
jgi:O-acetyl-ADP-ribose deacetylase (regulator of RNase III)